MRGVFDLAEEFAQEVDAWFASRPAFVRKAYQSNERKCSLQVPVLRYLAQRLQWPDDSLFDELSRRYSNPLPVNDFLNDNLEYTRGKLRRCKVDAAGETMAAEIAADVRLAKDPLLRQRVGVDQWCRFRDTCTLPTVSHGGPGCMTFAVHQVGADGRPKIRRAEGWRQSGANRTVGVPDTPAYHDVEDFAKLAAVIKRRVQGSLSTWGVDHDAAYRQLPVADPQQTYVILQMPSGPTLWGHNAYVRKYSIGVVVLPVCRLSGLVEQVPLAVASFAFC